MSLISMEFLIFVGIAVIGYYLIPKRFQWIWLLIFSYIYYASSGIKILFFLLYTTITTYGTGRLLDRVNHKELPRNEAKSRKRRILIGCLLLNFGMLAVLKYTNFAIENVNAIFHAGISFQKLILRLESRSIHSSPWDISSTYTGENTKPRRIRSDLPCLYLFSPSCCRGPSADSTGWPGSCMNSIPLIC